MTLQSYPTTCPCPVAAVSVPCCTITLNYMIITKITNVPLNDYISPLKFTPRGRGHHFVAIKHGVLRKTYKVIGFRWVFLLTKVGPCASTTSFHHPSILYGGILSPGCSIFVFPEYEFCLHAWTLCPKKGTIWKNLFLYHFPSFFSIVIKEQPILFVRKWAQWYVRQFFLKCWRKVKQPGWQGQWHGCQFWDLSSYNSAACLHQGPSMQANKYSEKEKSNIWAKYTFLDAKTWLMHKALPFCMEILFICAHSFCRLFARAHVL